MEIKELSFMENLSDNDKQTFVRDSVIGGHSYDYSYSYSSDYYGYSDHPFFQEIIIDFDFRKITIEVTKPETTFAIADADVDALLTTGLLNER